MTEKAKTPHSITITLGKTKGIIYGSGAKARSTNIQTVKQLLEQGHSEDEISDYLEIYFKTATILDYIRIAKKCNMTSDGLTDTDVQEEMEEDKEKRKEVEEYKKTRSERKKPLDS